MQAIRRVDEGAVPGRTDQGDGVLVTAMLKHLFVAETCIAGKRAAVITGGAANAGGNIGGQKG